MPNYPRKNCNAILHARPRKFGVLLSNRDQLTRPQRAAVAAIADTFIDSFLPARPHPADTDDDDDLNPPNSRNMPKVMPQYGLTTDSSGCSKSLRMSRTGVY